MSARPTVVVHKHTLKQAKADFAARGRPSLSAREQKQLERSIQLDRRAWGVKEREKKKVEATKKRQERERREKEGRERVGIGSQRRCDRFGYKSSQMHLGAFFGGGRGLKNEEEDVKVEQDGEEEETFGDDGVDDEMLLDVLGPPKSAQNAQQHPYSDSAVLFQTSSLPVVLSRADTEPPCTFADAVGDFWAELDSSTQIARELASDEKDDLEQRSARRAVID